MTQTLNFFKSTMLATALVACVSGCAVQPPAGDGHRSQQQPIARNIRTYCRDDVDRSGVNDVASAIRQSASSARDC